MVDSSIGLPLLALLLDFAWLVGAVLIGVIGRVMFRRPWRVEAVEVAGSRHVWNVVGFRAAGRRVDEIAAAVASGGSLPEPDSADVPVDVAGSPNRMGGPTYDRR